MPDATKQDNFYVLQKKKYSGSHACDRERKQYPE